MTFRIDIDWGYFIVQHVTTIPYGQPQFCYSGLHYSVLKAEIHQWFLDNNILYNLEYKDLGKAVGEYLERYSVVFENKDDAMLFKLTWGGSI